MTIRTNEEIVQALEATMGNMTAAAKQLNIHRVTLHRRMKSPELKELIEESEFATVSFVQSKLLEKISQGHFGAIKYFLDKKGAVLGYHERPENETTVHLGPSTDEIMQYMKTQFTNGELEQTEAEIDLDYIDPQYDLSKNKQDGDST